MLRRSCPLAAVSRFALVLPIVLASLLPVSAQSPVLPTSPEIVGYIRLVDPHALDPKMSVFRRPLGLEGVLPGIVQLLAAWTGDENLELAIPQQPVTVVWMRDGAGTISDVVILPQAASPNYLLTSARRVAKFGVIEGGMSLVGSERAVTQARKILPALKNLHEAVHPADVSCYFRDSLWSDRLDKVLGFLTEPDISGLKPLLNLPEGGAAPFSLGAVPAPVADNKKAAALPFELRVAGQILKDVEMIHLMLDPEQQPPRLTLHLGARDRTPLARFLSQPPAETNPTVRYLPEGGSFRSSLVLDMDTLEVLINAAVDSAAKEAGNLFVEQVKKTQEEYTRFFILKGAGCVGLNEGALDKPVRNLTVFFGNWLRRAVQNSAFPDYQTTELLNRINKVFPAPPTGRPPAPHETTFVTVLTPRQGRTSIERVQTVLSEQYPESSSQEVVFIPKNAQAEEFSIDQLFVVPRGSRPGPSTAATSPHRSVLSACRVANYLVLTSRYEDMRRTMSRILRLDPLTPSLATHDLFLDGAHLYADVRLPSAQNSASPNPPLFRVTARLLDRHLQLVVVFP